MVKANEESLKYASMPVHNPLYKEGSICFRGDVIRLELGVENSQEIASIVPKPLVYSGNSINIVFMMITELKEGFSEEYKPWNEIAIQIPVIYKGEPGIYVCENYTNDIGGIISGREKYGYPKVPGLISVKKNTEGVACKLFKYGTDKEIVNLTFRFFEKKPTPQKTGHSAVDRKMPQIILFKYIPSVAMNHKADVKQLVTMKYKKPVIHKQVFGEGKAEILEDAPRYLKEAGLTSKGRIHMLDMDIYLIGGEVLHNYN